MGPSASISLALWKSFGNLSPCPNHCCSYGRREKAPSVYMHLHFSGCWVSWRVTQHCGKMGMRTKLKGWEEKSSRWSLVLSKHYLRGSGALGRVCLPLSTEPVFGIGLCLSKLSLCLHLVSPNALWTLARPVHLRIQFVKPCCSQHWAISLCLLSVCVYVVLRTMSRPLLVRGKGDPSPPARVE